MTKILLPYLEITARSFMFLTGVAFVAMIPLSEFDLLRKLGNMKPVYRFFLILTCTIGLRLLVQLIGA